MTVAPARARASLGIALLLAALAAPVAAQPAADPGKEASRHFQRGVDLYNEGDFRGALVEFRKAHRVLPRASVLYNIGQTEYQIQEYAQALRTLERYLAETGPNAAHRAEVQETVDVLRTRVGWIALTANRADCDVTLDDQPAGTTPLSRALLVSVGRRRIVVACAGRARVAREVEVASGETVRVDLELEPAPEAPPVFGSVAPPVPVDPPGVSRRSARIAWTTTAVLAAASIGLYTAAIVGSRRLESLRRSYPVSPERLGQQARSNRRLAIAGDVVAGATVAAAGLSTYLSVSARGDRGLALRLSWEGIALGGSF